MTAAQPPAPALSLADLVDQVLDGRLAEREAQAQACAAGPPALTEAEVLRSEAEASAWYAPRRARVQALLAHVVITAHQPDSLLAAEAFFTLGITHNALDRCREALPFLQTAGDLFLSHARGDRAAWVNAEITLARAFLGDVEGAAASLEEARAWLADHPDRKSVV